MDMWLFNRLRTRSEDLHAENEREMQEGDASRPLLRIVSMSSARVQTGNGIGLESDVPRGNIRRVLRPHFRVHIKTIPQLSDANLEGVHLLMLGLTTSYTALTAAEQASLHRWVRVKGGVALLNSFCMYSNNDGYNAELIEWLGLVNPQSPVYMPQTLRPIDATELIAQHPALSEPLAGPYGVVSAFEHIGSSPFRSRTPVEPAHEPPQWICEELAYFGAPLGSRSQTVGFGAALVFGNCHWFHAPDTEGLLESTGTNSNAVLLLNIAARAARALPWSRQRHPAAAPSARAAVFTVLLVANRIARSKKNLQPHALPDLPAELWIKVLEQALICELEYA